MSFTISSDYRGCRGLRPWLSGTMLIAMLAVSACSSPANSEPEAARLLEPVTAESLVAESSSDDPAIGDPASGDAVGGRSLVDSEELIGLGELGLLPSLLQTFGAGIDCEFDDAFSTCQ